jgi:CheY-like chemotaxis protein
MTSLNWSARSLRRAGFNQPIVRCPDGHLALEYLSFIEAQSRPHVILFDLHLPGMSGLDVLGWVRERYSLRDVAVYLLTSSENPSHRTQATANCVTEYIQKSPLADDLIQKLDRLIAMSNNTDAEAAGEMPDIPPELRRRG